MKRESRTKIGGILVKRELARICLPSVMGGVGSICLIFEALGRREINYPFIVQSTGNDEASRSVTMCVAQAQLAGAREALEAAGASHVVYDEQVGIVSVFGPHFGERAGISGVMFNVLEGAGIYVQAISTSISSLSCVVSAEELDHAVEVLQAAFEMPQ